MAIEIIDKLKQKNNGSFKLVDAEDVDYDGSGKSLKDKIDELISSGSGISADNIVNDFTTGGIDKAASAETIKILNNTKADKAHIHSYSSLTDLPTLKTRVSDMDDATNYMTITQITTELNKKANISHTHTFDDLNGFFYDGDTTNIIIPTKLGQLNNDMNFVTKSYVDEQISNIDKNAGNVGDTSLFATKSDLNYKVDKIEGKGLSTNDFTDSYRLKLDRLTNFDDSEINQKYNNLISLVNIPYNSDTNSVQLTTDRYQYISNFVKDITINLPKVTTFTEIVLFFIPKDNFYLDMPTVTFNRNIVSMKKGSHYRMTFTYVNAQMGWISDVPTFIL